jgi:hypothetical protein
MKTLIKFKLDDLAVIYNQHQPMADIYDMVIQLAIIDYVKANTVCELGAASGNWSIIMHKLMDNTNARFTLVENFKEAEQYKSIGVPQNEQELRQRMKQFNFSPNFIIETVDNLPPLNEKVDVIRLDCDFDRNSDPGNLSNWILNNSSDRLIIFVDDIRMNKRPDRLFMMQEMVNRGCLEFLWGGHNEAAWCKPYGLNRQDLLEDIKEIYLPHYENLNRMTHLWYNDTTIDYITSRPQWIKDGKPIDSSTF